jgi:hypothetical protein
MEVLLNVQPSNVACWNNSAPHVQLSGCADFCIRFLLIHDVNFGITRASSLILTIFVYTHDMAPRLTHYATISLCASTVKKMRTRNKVEYVAS